MRIADAPTPAAFLQRRDGYYSVAEIAAGCGQTEAEVLAALREKRGFERRTYNGRLQFRRVKPTGGGAPRLLTDRQLAAVRIRLLSGERLGAIAREIWGETRYTSERGCYQALKRALEQPGGQS